MDYLGSALLRRKQNQLKSNSQDDSWDTDLSDLEDDKKPDSTKKDSQDVDTIVAKVIEQLKGQGIDVKGETVSELLQKFSKEYDKKDPKGSGESSSRKEFETPPPTGLGSEEGFSEGEDHGESPDERVASALSDDEEANSPMARRQNSQEPNEKMSEDTMRVMRDGLDHQTLDDIKRRGGKAKGLFQKVQKSMAKRVGKA